MVCAIFLHEVSICTGTISVLPFIIPQSIFIHFVHHGKRFYDRYIASDEKNKYVDDDKSHIIPKQRVINIYNAKYEMKYSNLYYVLKIEYTKDKIQCQKYSVRKQKAAGFVYLKGSTYRDAKGPSQLTSCLYGAIINSSPIIRGKIQIVIV